MVLVRFNWIEQYIPKKNNPSLRLGKPETLISEDLKLMGNQLANEQLYRQWYRFIEDHGFTWKGILVRYEGDGEIKNLLNSIRKFTAKQDKSEIEHYLCFTNQNDPSQVYERSFIIGQCGPGIIHPVDPTSIVMFSSYGSGLMSRSLSKDDVNYAEIYMNTDSRRISVVIIYDPDQYILSRISLFREVKHTENNFPWSEDKPEIGHREYPHLNVISSSLLSSETFEESSLSDSSINWSQKNRLIFDFPDGISINVPETLKFGQKDNLIVSWQYNDRQIKRAIAQFNDCNRSSDLITQDCVII
jgi:hypothetical protein